MPTQCDIALVISDLGSGGAQKVLVQLAEAWRSSGKRVVVITLAGEDLDFHKLAKGVSRIVIGGVGESRSRFGGLWANAMRILRLRRALRTANPAVAVSFVAQTSILTIIAALGLNMRAVVSERNDPRRQSLGPIWNFLRRVVYPWADLVTANSRGALDTLADFVARDQLLYVPNPLTPPPASEAMVLAAPTILTIGRLSHQKAHDVLLKAFAIFCKSHLDWRLAIMGEGQKKASLLALTAELGIMNSVDWIGTQSDPYTWLQAARIFVLVSRHEGSPNALMEAMSCGLPCIISDGSPGPLELIENEVSGAVVPLENPVALASALAQLADDPVLAKRLGDAARERVKSFDPSVVMGVWDAAIGRP
jgi:glycosyltransferase involved in cell wall biosynthesis